MAHHHLWRSQNFFRRVSVVKKIIRLANLSDEDLVLEIGAGRGIITKQLARCCLQVIAVEYDRSLCRDLRRAVSGHSNVEIVCADFRHYTLPEGEYKVVASIPFEITSDIMAKLTTGGRSPLEAYLVMQEEAARRFAGSPYDRESLKSLLLKPSFELSVLHSFRSTDFHPSPGVNVILLRIRRRRSPMLCPEEELKYRDFVHFVFSEHGGDVAARLQPIFTRRQLRRLARDNGFVMSARVTELSFPQWLAIFRHYLEGVVYQKQSIVAGAERRLFRRQARLDKVHRSRSHSDWREGAQIRPTARRRRGRRWRGRRSHHH
ncbi:MAG: 23S ribosomal RNA methyltransferase Erm [Armatimonadetes bacterium]|nr:23S ribosomal RNA methyltransferase Erm [Armatimonadota bacterium]